MFGIVRLLLIVGGMVASWFVGRETNTFLVMQSMFALLALTAMVAIAAFWPSIKAKITGVPPRE